MKVLESLLVVSIQETSEFFLHEWLMCLKCLLGLLESVIERVRFIDLRLG
jgi:hypothetical protein